jgi:uncharacterized membrane protein YkvA (DUF1232 family)
MNPTRFLRTVRTALPAILPLMRDPRVPGWLKLGAVAAALTIVSPLDPFGDIPVLGFLDDAVLLALVVNAFVAFGVRFAAQEVRVAHDVARSGSAIALRGPRSGR